MNYKYKHTLNYINWQKEAKYQTVSQAVWNSQLKKAKRNGHRAASRTKRCDFNDNDYLVIRKRSYLYLYTFNHYDGYQVYTTNPDDDSKNFRTHQERGKNAFQMVELKFKEIHNGMTIRKAYGYSPEEVKRCIPKSFYYTNDMYMQQLLPIVSVCDFCSQYPSCGCGILPDWNERIELSGTASPTEEYPFAFYLKSGHIAEYGRFDSHEWLDSFYYKALFRWEAKDIDKFRPDVKPEEDLTILCKASKYKMDDIWKFYYDLRNKDSKAKLVMNATIGFMHLKSYKERKLAHLAAVIIARANDRMRKLAERIGHNKVCHIVIDGIIYLGDHVYGTKTKALNNLYQEHTDVECFIRSANAYIIQDHDGNIIEIKHGAFDATADGEEITIENTKNYMDIMTWHRADGVQLEEGDYADEVQI